jgi:hypothetical protein
MTNMCQVVVRHPVPLHLTPCFHCYSTARYHTNISSVKHFGHGSFNRRRISRNLRRHHFTVAPQRPSRPVVLRGLAPLKNVLQGGSHRRHVGVLRTHRMYVLSLKQTDTLSQSLCQMSSSSETVWPCSFESSNRPSRWKRALRTFAPPGTRTCS